MEVYKMENIKENKGISVKFTDEEAIVLFEWLSKFNEAERPALFQDQAEQRVLFDLEAELEKVISQTFDSNYMEKLSSARQKIRDSDL